MKIHCQKGLSVGSSVCLTPGMLGKERQVSLLWSLSSPSRTILWHFTRGPTPTSLTEVWCPSEYFTSALQSMPLALQNSAGNSRKRWQWESLANRWKRNTLKIWCLLSLYSPGSHLQTLHTHAWKRCRKLTSMPTLWSIKTNLMEAKWTCSNSARWENTLKTRGICSLSV